MQIAAWLCEYPGPSSRRCPVRACSLVSSLLLVRATMSQEPSLRQSGRFVRRALTAYRSPHGPDPLPRDSNTSGLLEPDRAPSNSYYRGARTSGTRDCRGRLSRRAPGGDSFTAVMCVMGPVWLVMSASSCARRSACESCGVGVLVIRLLLGSFE
jgi:hypothetical protein